VPHLNALARGDPLRIAISDISSVRNYILSATVLLQKVSMYLQQVLLNRSQKLTNTRPLRRLRSFKVTDFGINQKPLYTTFYQRIILTYILSCTVSKLWPIVGQIFASNNGLPHFNALAGVIPCEYLGELYLLRN